MEKKMKVEKVNAAQQQEKKPQAVSPKQTPAPSGIVAKAKERFSQEDEAHIVRPKAQEQSISAPIVKKDISVDHKENTLPKSVKTEAQKPAEQVPVL
jgi:DNA invertase Pin-like site-specific DNA recombinase